MVRDEQRIADAIRVVSAALEAARNANQAGEDAVVAMAAAGEMKGAATAVVHAHGDTDGNDFVGWCRVLGERVDALEAALAKAEGRS